MTGVEHLVQDLRAHAHEAPAVCAALMRRAASELKLRQELVVVVEPLISSSGGKHRRPKESARC